MYTWVTIWQQVSWHGPFKNIGWKISEPVRLRLTSKVWAEAVVVILQQGIQQLRHVVCYLVSQPRLLLNEDDRRVRVQ